MKSCIACAEEIKDEAQLCRYCSTLQNDSRFLKTKLSEQPKHSAKRKVVETKPREHATYGDGFCPRCGVRLASDTELKSGICNTCLSYAGQDANLIEQSSSVGTKEPANRFAIPALVIGIVGAFLNVLLFIPIAALIFGGIGLARGLELRVQGHPAPRVGISIAAVILGIIYIIIGVYQITVTQI